MIGALVGLGAGFTKIAEETWPTNEMEIRGETQGLLTGIAIAIPSGMGVCLSILGGNTSSLVGVAISASLLPPAVNTGICLVYSIFLQAGWVDAPESMSDARDFVKIGGISFVLTVVNIFCIWVSGIVMFEIKEVAPTQAKSAFWAKDIKVARELNKEKRPVDMSVIRQGLKSAFNRSQSEKPVNDVRPKRDKGSPPWVAARNNNLNSVFAFEKRKRNKSRFNFFGASVEEEPEDEAADENVRYVGLEDMAKLLGFDYDSDEDHEDENASNNVVRSGGRKG